MGCAARNPKLVLRGALRAGGAVLRAASSSSRPGGFKQELAPVPTGLLTAVNLFIALAAAWWAALQGGSHRDKSINATLLGARTWPRPRPGIRSLAGGTYIPPEILRCVFGAAALLVGGGRNKEHACRGAPPNRVHGVHSSGCVVRGDRHGGTGGAEQHEEMASSECPLTGPARVAVSNGAEL
jgi:hypothetical protein